MNNPDRQILLLETTKKLVICTSSMLSLILFFFFFIFPMAGFEKTFLTIIVFGTGIVGGFVSLQQRIHNISNKELEYLSKSWSNVLLIPIYGGIFALAIHVIFLSEIVTGNLFPQYYTPHFSYPPATQDFKDFFQSTLPESSPDTAKMIFWAFCAGFSERLVPQIIQSVHTGIGEGAPK